MDFGAWGPRFKRSDAPDGDWMVQTNLWVRGFAANSRNNGGQQQGGSEEDVKRQEIRQRQLATLRTTMASFLLAYLVLETVLLSTSALRLRSSVPGILHALRRQVMSPPNLNLVMASLSTMISKGQLVKMVLAGIAAPWVNQYRELANRRWLWSRRKVFGAPMAAAVGILSVRMAVALAMGAAGLR